MQHLATRPAGGEVPRLRPTAWGEDDNRPAIPKIPGQRSGPPKPTPTNASCPQCSAAAESGSACPRCGSPIGALR
ncbi:hypothetical protein RM572_00660 [Streptomyces sp. DSM 42041]|uniref:Zinc ribbon domain-containing protein n=1 Tax=Streptomyces hazeniae TaxID=3075538 RepID=A0ABU2NLE1_9ACTN|nr:hypothetical protein [Streptomyces sp. DSM 42041]MDT0377287.1 hypothetical protein [Streptomyces sp. DSM 42041]